MLASDGLAGTAQPAGMPALARRLAGLGTRLLRHCEAAQAAFADAHARFAGVRTAVSEAVMGLQFHDIARQRLDHAMAAVERILGLLERGRLSDDGELLPPARRWRATGLVAGLAAAQLRSLAADCAREAARLRASLRAVADELAAVEAISAALYAGGDPGQGAAGGSVMAELEQELDRALAAFAAGERARDRQREALAACVAEAAPLAGIAAALIDSEAHLQIAGLNAVIRAAELDGRNEVIPHITQELRGHAARMKIEVKAFEAGVVRSLAAIATIGERVLPALHAAEAALRGGFERSAAVLCRLEAAARREHGTAHQMASGLVGLLRALAEEVRFEDEAVAAMQATAARLESLVQQVLDEAADGGEPWPELTALLEGAYTMASERAVHAGVLGGAPAAALPDPAAAAADDLDDVLF
jgi:hypothetical protein